MGPYVFGSECVCHPAPAARNRDYYVSRYRNLDQLSTRRFHNLRLVIARRDYPSTRLRWCTVGVNDHPLIILRHRESRGRAIVVLPKAPLRQRWSACVYKQDEQGSSMSSSRSFWHHLKFIIYQCRCSWIGSPVRNFTKSIDIH